MGSPIFYPTKIKNDSSAFINGIIDLNREIEHIKMSSNNHPQSINPDSIKYGGQTDYNKSCAKKVK